MKEITKGDSLTDAKDKINKASARLTDLRVQLLKFNHEEQEKFAYDIEMLLYKALDDLDKISQHKEAEAVGCEHPRSERTYIGQNMLRCNKCGKEFS